MNALIPTTVLSRGLRSHGLCHRTAGRATPGDRDESCSIAELQAKLAEERRLAIAIQTPVDGEFEDVEEKEEVAPFPEVRTRCEVLKAVESVQISASSIAKPSKRRLTFLFLNWNLMEIKP